MNNLIPEDYLREQAVLDAAKANSVQYELSTGCWIDGHWGIYGVTRLIEIAQDLGFEISDDDERAMVAYKDHEFDFIGVDGFEYDASQWVMDTADDAEDWLNENIAKPGYSFGWSDGEFFLMPINWWEEDAW